MTLRHYLDGRFFNKALIRNNGIARRIMLAVILFSSLITGVITAVELYLEYRQDMRGIDERVESIRQVSLPTLTESVWVAETTQIQNLLKGMLNLSDIEYLGIHVDGQMQWSAGVRRSKRYTETIIELRRPHRGQELIIGELHVVASVDNVVSRLWSLLIATLISNGIKTFLVTVFVLLIFQAMVGQHLEHISWFMRRFGKDAGDGAQLVLNRPPAGLWRPDALDHVSRAINDMRLAIQDQQGRLQTVNERLGAVIDTAPLAIITRDLDGNITSWNPAAEEMFGWTSAEILGKPLPFLRESDTEQARSFRARILSGEVLKQIEVLRQRRDGSPIHLSLSAAPLRDAQGQLTGYFSILADITQRKLAEDRIRFLAFHDTLTHLPNRQLLQERFEQARGYAARGSTRIAMLFVDLDNFKRVNDSLGHDVGDAVLKEVAARLQTCVRETDTISRQGGDEFILLLSEVDQADDAVPALVKIMETVQLPYLVAGHEISLSASIGLALYPDDGLDFETLLKKADVAMYQAKDAGRNAYRFFDEAMNREAVEYLVLRNDLRRALDRGELRLHYQPQFDLASNRVVGVEALLRWEHPEKGLLTPERFIPIAEESGLIVPMGHWVIQEACRQGMAWRAQGLPALTMAVNLSAVQFRRGDIEESVSEALRNSGLPAELLELELTESIMLQNAEDVLAVIRRLKRLGVTLSIDDFGTGYSSLSYLKRFEVDKLKIDKSFVRDLASDPDDAAIVRAIVQLARSLNLHTIAEGVETAEMLALLRVYECDVAQGYHLARPLPAQQCTDFLRQHVTGAGRLNPA